MRLLFLLQMHGYDTNPNDYEYPSPLINTTCDTAYEDTNSDNNHIECNEAVNFEQLIGH